jgi:hypothetical protein
MFNLRSLGRYCCLILNNGEKIYPPTQKTPGVSPEMNASDGPSVARRAKEGECFGGFRRRN